GGVAKRHSGPPARACGGSGGHHRGRPWGEEVGAVQSLLLKLLTRKVKVSACRLVIGIGLQCSLKLLDPARNVAASYQKNAKVIVQIRIPRLQRDQFSVTTRRFFHSPAGKCSAAQLG